MGHLSCVHPYWISASPQQQTLEDLEDLELQISTPHLSDRRAPNWVHLNWITPTTGVGKMEDLELLREERSVLQDVNEESTLPACTGGMSPLLSLVSAFLSPARLKPEIAPSRAVRPSPPPALSAPPVTATGAGGGGGPPGTPTGGGGGGSAAPASQETLGESPERALACVENMRYRARLGCVSSLLRRSRV